MAGKCLAGLAAGLKKRFQPYAIACLSSILEKFREKKQNVVQALREAADAIFLSVSINISNFILVYFTILNKIKISYNKISINVFIKEL